MAGQGKLNCRIHALNFCDATLGDYEDAIAMAGVGRSVHVQADVDEESASPVPTSSRA